MTDINLGSLELDVVGGVKEIDLSIDIGSTGPRGSRFWAGTQGPLLDLVNQDVQLYDIYLNRSNNTLSQYVINVGSPSWVEAARLNVEQNLSKIGILFTNGDGNFTIPISSITTDANVTVNNFIISMTVEDPNPHAISIESSISGTNLVVDINGIMYDRSNSTWVNFSGIRMVHIVISYNRVQII